MVFGGVPTRLNGQDHPLPLERHLLSQKKRFTSACALLRLNRTKQILYGGITKRINFNDPRPLKPVRASIEPNDTEL